MRLQKSADAPASPPAPDHAELAREVSQERLRRTVERISVPRNFFRERTSNERIARWIRERLESEGLETRFQGEYRNVVAETPACASEPCVLIGAHYDSVPGSPGADDNGSAVAAMLECATLLTRGFPERPWCFVAFNCEEDGLLGSADFVDNYLPESSLRVALAQVLEMVGYCDHRPGSQSMPAGLPIEVPEAGDFLGIIADGRTTAEASRVLALARGFCDDFPVLSLSIRLGLEHFFPDLERSDHASFWRHRIPSLMWTDTSEFRNRHYHRSTDTPETLDYDFLERVTQLLLLSSLAAGDAG